jgi:endonuclease/exonuclease/phosphatase family metal-dependent hydrolase
MAFGLPRWALACALASPLTHFAAAQLRVATYNITNYPSAGLRQADLANVIYGVNPANGLTLRPDILIVQEMESTGAVNNLRTFLNNAHGSDVWALGTFIPPAGGCNDTSNAVLYRTDRVIQIAAITISTGACDPNPPRTLQRWDLALVGYNGARGSILSVYATHMKAGSTTTDLNRRLVEAQRLVANAATLPPERHFLLAGDLNIQSSSQSAYTTLVGPNPADPTGPFFDPIFTPGNWNNNAAFRFVHTQDPATEMDDRFDQILLSATLLDADGMHYIGDHTRPYSTSTWNDPNHSYRAWGNDGSSYNTVLRTTTNTMVGPSIAQSIINVAAGSGHVPVYLDIRVPARLGVSTDTIDFGAVRTGNPAHATLRIHNAGEIERWNTTGIDQLRYSLAASPGFLAPAGNFTAYPDAPPNTHTLAMDTSTPGPRSGTLTIASNAGDRDTPFLVTLTGMVLCTADWNADGVVDFNDFLEYLNDYNNEHPDADLNGDGVVDFNDLLVFLNAYNAGC